MGITSKRSKIRLMNGASALAITGMLNFALPAMAQDAAQDQDSETDSGAIEVIVVTGTKRALNIQDVAQSITAFSTADIERRGILNMANVAAAIPSISLTSTRPGVNEIVYRGVSSGSGDWYKDSQVAVYLDDQPMTASTTQIDPRMVDIERIESLPGPQGTLFGSSSQTGTLRIITNKPSFERFSGQANGEVSTTKGGEMSYDFSGHINVPLVEDKFAIRVVGYKARDGGYIDNVLNDA
ncbi:MAG: TonB-dependent receptor plug domain-containing protein, partial [Emcibacteraceae bacterium]|nr:TonB-dependent receptor plug domain-containing protein [Emcibacteraceae bacterium]